MAEGSEMHVLQHVHLFMIYLIMTKSMDLNTTQEVTVGAELKIQKVAVLVLATEFFLMT
jgi:hypothetical protein